MSSERGAFRGRGGRGGDRGGRGGGARGAHGGGAAGGQTERPKKENILDLNKYMDKRITVKFSGGREGVCPSPALCLGQKTDNAQSSVH
jgi:U6 snRNA-associated Sm-like protein LSm7